jgi:hypothetical protein
VDNNTGTEKIRERIHQVLLMHPGAPVSLLHPRVRPYDKNWRVVFEEMVKAGEIIRESCVMGRHVYFRHFSTRDLNLVVAQNPTDADPH